MLIFVWLFLTFLLGIVVGSGLNVCISRIPFEKSILWPSSRCDSCLRPIRWFDNLPIIGYLVLKGKCRACKQPYSARHLWIELITGLGFVAIFLLDVKVNVLQIAGIKKAHWRIQYGDIPFEAWCLFAAHVTLFSFLMVASISDIEHTEIPLSLTVTGTLIGILFGLLLPWPYPNVAPAGAANQFGFESIPPIATGAQLWPFWDPSEMPISLRVGSWQLGFLNSFLGALAGALLLRGIRFLFGLGRGMEGMGIGDADLMMMAGAFLGWQAVILAFFVSILPALVLGILQILIRGNQMLPFGPSLSMGVLATTFGWNWISAPFRQLFFNRDLLITLGIAGGLGLLIMSFLLRLTRGRPQEEGVK